jgi:hypothetical protein
MPALRYRTYVTGRDILPWREKRIKNWEKGRIKNRIIKFG